MSGEAMESVPSDVRNKILAGLTIAELCRLKCLSKPLNTQIKDPDFTKLYDKLNLDQTDGIKLIVLGNLSVQTLNIDHQNLSCPLVGLPVNNTQLVGSSNGLVSLYHHPNSYSLLNPTTREFRVLPNPGTFRNSIRDPIRLSGFGYVAQLDDFMVVSAAIHIYGMLPSVVKVYSAKFDSWETMPARVKVPAYAFSSTVSVYLNGVAHWLGWTGYVDAYDIDSRVCVIVGFDFADKEFKLLPLHENINQWEIMAFSVLDGDGCLCVLARAADLSLEMWVMNKYGDVESWTKTFSFRRTYTPKSSLSIFPICDAGKEVLFEINGQLVLYDHVKDETKKLKAGLWKIRGSEGWVLQIARYEESLVSPSGYISQDIRQIPNNVAEENEGLTRVSVYEALQNVYGAIQCPYMQEMLHRMGSPGINILDVS